MKTSLLIWIFFLSLTLAAAAEDFSIKAEVDKVSLSTDDALSYKITIISSKENISKPLLPRFDGFNLVSQAQTSTVSFANNERKINIAFVYLLSPREAGKIKIEPASIKILGSTYSTQAFEIEVTQGKAKSILPAENPYPETPQITL